MNPETQAWLQTLMLSAAAVARASDRISINHAITCGIIHANRSLAMGANPATWKDDCQRHMYEYIRQIDYKGHSRIVLEFVTAWSSN